MENLARVYQDQNKLKDAEKELADIKSRMTLDYELPPLDFIG